MPVAEAKPHPTEPHTVHLQSSPQVGPNTFLFVLSIGDLIIDIHYPEVQLGIGSRINAGAELYSNCHTHTDRGK